VLAARRWRSLGRPIPEELVRAELTSAIGHLGTPLILAQVRAAYDGPLLLLKGPEVAARYPDPILRPFGDVDLLAAHPQEAQRSLLAAGFVEARVPPHLRADHHHEPPLKWPGLPLRVEIHSRPNWPRWLEAPSSEALFAEAVSAHTGPEDILTLPPPQHSVLLATHAWAHAPLASLRDLIDIAAMAEGVDEDELEAISRAWGVARIWRTTREAGQAVFGERRRRSGAECVWARNLAAVRERTVFESHLENWVSPFWALPPARAFRAVAAAVAAEFTPGNGEPWSAKLTRSRKALVHAFERKSAHDEAVAAAERRRKAAASDRSENTF
jgi:hypothetical protein